MTSKHHVSELEARAVAEAAREAEWTKPSFARELFLGRLRMDLISSLPELSAEEQKREDLILAQVESFLKEHVDTAQIERDAKIPEAVVEGLAKLGLFGIKIPAEYGGLGFSQRTYNRIVALVGAHCPAMGALLSAHQSIGVPQPLKLFGTPEQKKKYLPRIAKGAISAFALTETDVGSDPARLGTTAMPTEDGTSFVINGEKLWCTNGPVAELLVVMAKTPAQNPGERDKITAFIVEANTPGVEVVHRLAFMGLRGIENGVIRFTNVRVPRENIIWGEGKGLKLALVTLNTGRLTIPAMCAAAGKWCLQVSRDWAARRVQWGKPVGQHEAIGQKLAEMAAQTFAMESMAEVCAGLADADGNDIRLEAAIAKLWTTEVAWRIADETVQIKGGRGYETSDSLASRREESHPVERVLRDLRINRIFEGSSEIMRLFIAREALDPHFKPAGALLDPGASMGAKLVGAIRAGLHFAAWFPTLLLDLIVWPAYASYGSLGSHVRYVGRTAKRLGRNLTYVMALNGPKLEHKQATIFRLVDVGAELFAMSVVCARAKGLGTREAHHLADLFCRLSRRRIEALFQDVWVNEDAALRRVSEDLLKGRHAWLEEGIISPVP